MTPIPSKYAKMRFWLSLHPVPHWGAHDALVRPSLLGWDTPFHNRPHSAPPLMGAFPQTFLYKIAPVFALRFVELIACIVFTHFVM